MKTIHATLLCLLIVVGLSIFNETNKLAAASSKPIANPAADQVPSFIRVGHSYIYGEGGGMTNPVTITVLEIGPGGWIKAKVEKMGNIDTWINTNRILLVVPVD